MNTADALSLNNLSIGYRQHGDCDIIVLDSLDAALPSGSLTCLLGPNGAGKSTLLKTLAGFLQPLSGSITANGRDFLQLTDAERARTVAVVLTSRVSADNMTVEELVMLGRSPYTGFFGIPGRQDREVADTTIELCGIGDLRLRRVATLSDGERQKAMIARALAQATPFILLDEPSAFLDYPSKVEMMLLLRRLAESSGKTILLSTHDLDIALQTADNLWLVDRRLGLTQGSPDQLGASGDIGRYFNSPHIHYNAAEARFRLSN